MRIARYADDSEDERVLVAGAERGAVTVSISPGGRVRGMAVHSPAEVPGWYENDSCTRLEMPCWYLSTWAGPELDPVFRAFFMAATEEDLWLLLEQSYAIYLGGH
jgi:hypothetical protein